MRKKIPYPKPDDGHKYAFMSDPTSGVIGFPKNRLTSDNKLSFPFPGQLNTSEPLKLIEECKDNEECPARDYGELDSNYLALAEDCPITENNGCPLFLTAFAENKSRDLGWKEIFEFDDSSMLDIIISNFHKLKNTLKPPIKLGHDETQALVQNSGFPSAGWITDLKRESATNKLLAYFSSVPEAIIRLIENGSYKRLSAELYNNYIDPVTKKAFGPTIRAVSILGADVPRIKTLEDLTVIYHSDKLPYKILTEEENMDPAIKKLTEIVKGLKKDVKKLEEHGLDDKDSVIQALRKRIADLEAQINTIGKSSDNPVPSADDIQLAEKFKIQDGIISKLSETIKTIGSELQHANKHILEDKKTSFRAVNSKSLTPAFLDKALESINFAEEDNKVLELVTLMVKLNDEGSLFLAEPADIDEVILDPKVIKLSQDTLHNEVTALAEKDKISYTEAFDRVLLLKKA